MNETPRLRSAWPSTPESPRRRLSKDSDHAEQSVGPILQARSGSQHDFPAISLELVDAPSQRLYILLIYIFMTIWRFYDYTYLTADGIDGFWMFTKWVGLDTAFLYGLAGLNVPWIQWSSSAFTTLFIAHAAANWCLMFQIPLPITPWLLSIVRFMYDREYAISERYVKAASILQNSSVILGKQIIHILPEGSAVLNSEQSPYCIGNSIKSTHLPIMINQTRPILIQIDRTDLDTNLSDTIIISGRELKRLLKASFQSTGEDNKADPTILQYPVRRTGLYRLQTVIDESKLEVQRRSSSALVVRCPAAWIKPQPPDKCKGDLSDLDLQVSGVPPFKVKYSKTVNRDDHGHTVLSVHPEHHLPEGATSYNLASIDPMMSVDLSWARKQSIQVPLNESLGISGHWQYMIDEVHDAWGNTVNYTEARLSEAIKDPADSQPVQILSVHERPKVAFRDCNPQATLKVERGRRKSLGMTISSTDVSMTDKIPYKVTYGFTPQNEIEAGLQHYEGAVVTHVSINHPLRGEIQVTEPGLYSLKAVNSPYCSGEILEPSSCQLVNPPEPDLSINAQHIPDKCAGHSIGLTVNLDLFGSPPFQVYYKIRDPDGSITPKVIRVDRFHRQIDLRPVSEGHYSYHFYSISDAVYDTPRSLGHENLVLSQDVKPPASARIENKASRKSHCLGEPVSFTVRFSGEAPYILNYELVHGSKRIKQTTEHLNASFLELTTEQLNEGGEYAIALTSITDATGCKRTLDDEIKFSVRLQRPRASFGRIKGKRNVLALEDHAINLPIKLQGEPPWQIHYQNKDDSTKEIVRHEVSNHNAEIRVNDQGTYVIIAINDAACPGIIDTAGSEFLVEWIPRPRLELANSSLIEDKQGAKFRKAVCEGDEDATELNLSGTVPFSIEYEQRQQNDHGPRSAIKRNLASGVHRTSFRMETSEPGYYSYQFSGLSDASYHRHAKNLVPTVVHQRVYPRPVASFVENGRTYRYCREEGSDDEVLQITMDGMPPFSLELEIKHSASSKSQPIHVPNVDSIRYNLRLPHRMLSLGLHVVTIRKIQDAHNCWRNMDLNTPSVMVSVADLPSISPLQNQVDFCVGDRISYLLSGAPPFQIYYTFQDQERKATISHNNFRRIADSPGEFVISALSDSRSTEACKARVHLPKTIHEMPSVRLSQGGLSTTDIHEGGEADLVFNFGGTPPFHYTYIRSTTPARGKKGVILETKNGVSHQHSTTIKASDAGTYEVVAIRDKYCAFSLQQDQAKSHGKLSNDS